MFGFGKKQSPQALFDDGKAAFERSDYGAALASFQQAMDRAGVNDVVVVGRAMALTAECARAVGNSAGADTLHALALTTLSLLAPEAPEHALCLKRVRAAEKIDATDPDGVVVAAAWLVDVGVKLSEGDVEGTLVALRGCTSTLAQVFGPDNARQVSAIARTARLMTVVAPQQLAALIEKLVDDALRIAETAAVPANERGRLLQTRAIVRFAAGNREGSIAACKSGIAIVDGVPHSDVAESGDENLRIWFRVHLAEMLRVRDDFDGARVQLEAALAIARQTAPGSAVEARITADIAWLFSRFSRDDEAAAAFEQAFAMFRSAGTHDDGVRGRYEQWVRESGRTVTSAPE